jgi:Fe-Mn family superoxide dismutase
MQHTLSALPYQRTALEPHMSAETLDYHHGKHLQTYVSNLNRLVVGTEFEHADLETIMSRANGPLFNNAAQAWNHTFFFEGLTPDAGGVPQENLATAIARRFNGTAGFEDAFMQSALDVFGSGWTWLVQTRAGGLDIVNTTNGMPPPASAGQPLLTLDVWEHAYYRDDRNSRQRYIEAYMRHLLNWPIVNERWDATSR